MCILVVFPVVGQKAQWKQFKEGSIYFASQSVSLVFYGEGARKLEPEAAGPTALAFRERRAVGDAALSFGDMAPSTVSVALPTSIKLINVVPHRHAQKLS